MNCRFSQSGDAPVAVRWFRKGRSERKQYAAILMQQMLYAEIKERF